MPCFRVMIVVFDCCRVIPPCAADNSSVIFSSYLFPSQNMYFQKKNIFSLPINSSHITRFTEKVIFLSPQRMCLAVPSLVYGTSPCSEMKRRPVVRIAVSRRPLARFSVKSPPQSQARGRFCF